MNVIVLAGGFDQIDLINEFKARGARVVLIDYYDNPPAKKHADFHYQASTLDIDAVKKISIEEQADILTTACTDQALLIVAQVSEELNLPCYISYEKAMNVTNKMYMKNKMKKFGIPTAKHSIVSDINQVDLKDFKFPVVVKPTDCNSSKGVKRVSSIGEGLLYINEALSLSRSRSAIIEEYIDGFEVSVDAFITEGKVDILLITESKKIPNSNGFTITQSKYPVDIDNNIINQIKSIIISICTNFDIFNGPLLIQMIISDKDVFVIEFSARMGGGTKHKLIEVLTGLDIMKTYVDLVQEKKIKIDFSRKYQYAHLNYCYARKGRFTKLIGFDELKQQGIIHDYFKYKSEGTFINKSETSSDRVAGYLITANTMEELISKEKIANSNLKILSDDDVDIMRHDLI